MHTCPLGVGVNATIMKIPIEEPIRLPTYVYYAGGFPAHYVHVASKYLHLLA